MSWWSAAEGAGKLPGSTNSPGAVILAHDKGLSPCTPHATLNWLRTCH